MKYIYRLSVLLLLFASCITNNESAKPAPPPPGGEIIYHVVQRSFYDSNGDQHGDLNGLRAKLDYLQELGITSILLLPLYESVYYHNYFASDFEKIDPLFGSTEDFIELVKDIHSRGMKIYMDMETQYVTEDHPWYKESFGNPESEFSEYITYDDSAQLKPSTIVYDLDGLLGYDSVYRIITTVNMNSEKVKEYNLKLFSYWMDPNGDGDFSDGVDGFRLDHMMDDLDKKGRWTNLFKNFWKPMIEKLRAINPEIIFMAEQANWGSFGFEYFNESDIDWVFAFRIAFEIRNMDKQKLELMADSIFSLTPENRNQIVFIENHDVPRFATMVNEDPGKLRLGAALNLLLGGVPSIYYGQEIGMRGGGEWMRYGMTDGNEIPEREAFEWYQSDTGKGMTFWYRDSGPWWDSSLVKPDDGISLQEQKNVAGSLWSYYKEVIALRKKYHSFFTGKYQTVTNNSDQVFSYMRTQTDEALLVATNFSDSSVTVVITSDNEFSNATVNPVFGNDKLEPSNNSYTLTLPAYGVHVSILSKNRDTQK